MQTKTSTSTEIVSLTKRPEPGVSKLIYVREMLQQLNGLVDQDKQSTLHYLIDMAILEAGSNLNETECSG